MQQFRRRACGPEPDLDGLRPHLNQRHHRLKARAQGVSAGACSTNQCSFRLRAQGERVEGLRSLVYSVARTYLARRRHDAGRDGKLKAAAAPRGLGTCRAIWGRRGVTWGQSVARSYRAAVWASIGGGDDEVMLPDHFSQADWAPCLGWATDEDYAGRRAPGPHHDYERDWRPASGKIREVTVAIHRLNNAEDPPVPAGPSSTRNQSTRSTTWAADEIFPPGFKKWRCRILASKPSEFGGYGLADSYARGEGGKSGHLNCGSCPWRSARAVKTDIGHARRWPRTASDEMRRRSWRPRSRRLRRLPRSLRSGQGSERRSLKNHSAARRRDGWGINGGKIVDHPTAPSRPTGCAYWPIRRRRGAKEKSRSACPLQTGRADRRKLTSSA